MLASVALLFYIPWLRSLCPAVGQTATNGLARRFTPVSPFRQTQHMHSQRKSHVPWPENTLTLFLRRPIVIGLTLAVFTGLLFYPVYQFGFVNLDDPSYVTENPHVRDGLTMVNALWAVYGAHAGFWHPVTWWSHMLDVTCFGLDAAGPHLVNLGLHVLNVVLLFVILHRWTGALWRAAFAAALFAWHPLRVESVAWIAERKDVLSGLFFLLTLWAYGEFARGRRRPWLYYVLALVFFTLAAMSKPMVVTLPLILILVDLWPFARVRVEERASKSASFRRVLLEKIPFLIIAIGCSLVTIETQQDRGAVQSLTDCPVDVRIENALVSYVRYLGKTFWPVNLATPYADVRAWPVAAVTGAGLLLVGLTFVAVRLGRKYPFLPVGWLWFCGMLVPIIGIVQVGAQSMADRFTYLPSIGLFIVIAWSAGEAMGRWRIHGTKAMAVAGLILLGCAARTRDQLGYWRNSETLLSHAVAVTKNNWLAGCNLAWELNRQGRQAEAEQFYREAMAVNPRDFDILNNLGLILARQGRHAEAVTLFREASRLKPDDFQSHYNLARSLLQVKNYDGAIRHYGVFLQFKPDDVRALNDLGVALSMIGDLPGAMACFKEVLRIQPDNAEARFNMGAALALEDNTAAARQQFAEALRLRPGWAQAQQQLEALGTNSEPARPTGSNP